MQVIPLMARHEDGEGAFAEALRRPGDGRRFLDQLIAHLL
jgi:hypothetical protein